MFPYSQHCSYYAGVYTCSLDYLREYYFLLLHWLPLNILCLSGEYFFV